MTHRTFIAAILAAALAITGMTSVPARAGDDDIAKWIAGVAALAIIGAAIADKNKKDDRVVTRNQGYGYNQGHGHGHGKHQNKQRFFLPGQCMANAQTRSGHVRGYDRQCLLKNYAHFNSLPHDCAVRAWGEHRGRVLYHGRCLQQYGYRVAGR